MRQRKAIAARLAAAICMSTAAVATAQPYSTLWGATGEAWQASGRLPDHASAGYRGGAAPIPNLPVVTNVKDFGAVGDGVADDSNAFIAALNATQNGALLVPPGRYKITRVLQIQKKNVVLRGSGTGVSTLYFPQPLSVTAPADGLDWSWPYQGGYVWVHGAQLGGKLTDVVAAASRGSRTLQLASAAAIQPGQMVRLVQSNNASNDLVKSMQGGLAFQSDQVAYLARSLRSTTRLHDWVAKVQSVQGNSVTLDRPLRLDVKQEWTPELHAHAPTVEDVGIEHLSFEFSGAAKAAHNSEKGFNAIELREASNSWVRNVEIIDADYGVNARSYVDHSQFEDIVVRAAKRTSAQTCHHGLSATILSQELLFQRFRFATTCVHDLTVEGYANGNVFANGVHVKATLDHHKAAPYENLFTHLHTQSGSTLYNSGGGTSRGPHSGVRETLWNIQAGSALQALPATSQYPLLNVIGLAGYTESPGPNRWVELAGAGGVSQPNLHEAQVARKYGVYEAESATLSGAVAVTFDASGPPPHTGYRGHGYVDYLAPSNDYIEWTVHVPSTGAYRMDVRYAHGGTGTRSLNVMVDGLATTANIAFAPTGSWSNWSSAGADISLPAGSAVKLRLRATGQSGPNVDSVTLTPH